MNSPASLPASLALLVVAHASGGAGDADPPLALPTLTAQISGTHDGGRSWALMFENDEPDGFFDCFDFWNADHGLAFSDGITRIDFGDR